MTVNELRFIFWKMGQCVYSQEIKKTILQRLGLIVNKKLVDLQLFSKDISWNMFKPHFKYPDIIRRMPNAFKENVTSAVIDTESVAWDTEKKMILPFQVLTTRKVKALRWADFF